MAEDKVEKLMNFLIGQVIRNLKADPKHKGKCIEPTLIRSILEELLEKEVEKRNQNQVVDSKPSDQV